MRAIGIMWHRHPIIWSGVHITKTWEQSSYGWRQISGVPCHYNGLTALVGSIQSIPENSITRFGYSTAPSCRFVFVAPYFPWDGPLSLVALLSIPQTADLAIGMDEFDISVTRIGHRIPLIGIFNQGVSDFIFRQQCDAFGLGKIFALRRFKQVFTTSQWNEKCNRYLIDIFSVDVHHIFLAVEFNLSLNCLLLSKSLSCCRQS